MLRFGSALPLDFATIWQQHTGKRSLSAFHQIRARPRTLFPNGRMAMNNTFGEGSNKVRAANPRTLAAFYFLDDVGFAALLDQRQYGEKR
jgi:hypothetical protein